MIGRPVPPPDVPSGVPAQGGMNTEQVSVPKEVQALLDRYLATRESAPSEPLFLSRYGNRLSTRDVERILR